MRKQSYTSDRSYLFLKSRRVVERELSAGMQLS